MALRNQPYFPLYVQDYLTDEKLNMCSWATQGIYIKILCVLHKQESYGSILFKQNSKQNESKINFFASILIKNLPCQLSDMIEALNELIDNQVLYIDNIGLHQKRMVKDGEISDKRSKAGRKGGGNPNLFKQNSKQTDKQNTEYEYEYEDNINNNLYSLEEEKRLKEKFEYFHEWMHQQSVMDRLAMNRNVSQKDIVHCINEFFDTCYASITDKKNKFEVEQYFLNWVKIDGRVLEALNNQIRKRNAKKIEQHA